jgi:hypothetical protein
MLTFLPALQAPSVHLPSIFSAFVFNIFETFTSSMNLDGFYNLSVSFKDLYVRHASSVIFDDFYPL